MSASSSASSGALGCPFWRLGFTSALFAVAAMVVVGAACAVSPKVEMLTKLGVTAGTGAVVFAASFATLALT